MYSFQLFQAWFLIGLPTGAYFLLMPIRDKLRKELYKSKSSYVTINIAHMQACSQDLEKGGGYFERVRKVQTTLTGIFIDLESVSHGLSENSDENSRKARKFEGFFRPKSGGLQKKRSSPKLRLIFRPKSEIQRFFPPKIRWSPKKKVFAEIETDFSSAKFGNSNV